MSAGSSFDPLQEAIYNTLTADPTLMSMVTGVFDFVPDNENFPYVVIGEFTGDEFGTYVYYGQEVFATIHIWSQRIGPRAYQGRKQLNDIMNAIQRLLGRTSFPLIGWSNIGCWPDHQRTIIETDGTQHGVLRYRFKVLKD